MTAAWTPKMCPGDTDFCPHDGCTTCQGALFFRPDPNEGAGRIAENDTAAWVALVEERGRRRLAVWTCWRDSRHEVVQSRLGWPQCAVCGAAPPYHERPNYLPDGFTLDVFVPADNRASILIAERSAIVGLPNPSLNRTVVYFEGWINGAMQYADRDARGLWEAGLLHASSRMITGYPTIAQAMLRSETLHKVGTYDPRTHEVTITDEEAVESWLA